MPHGCPCVVPRASPESRLHHAYLSEHPTWWASTPICCRADSKNSGEGFPTTSASIPQAYWGERRGEATGEGPTCGGGLPLGTQGRSTGTAHRGPGASQGRGACAGRPPAARAGMTPRGAQWDTRGPLPTRHLPPARTPDRKGRWPAAGRATGVTRAPWPVFSLLPPAAQLRHSPARKARPRAPAPV